MKHKFSMSINITALRFDKQGRGIPTRVVCEGSDHQAQFDSLSQMASFQHKGSYYWIARGRSGWKPLAIEALN